ncbi:hypothetical protein OOT00_13805 [Desulfobotulus sp. H1]|uniref:ATP-grasp domain-containing protein n=1 Tax=Desulfobotulus pelophilus TaxID=2823377 RepID=A0ABT3NC81_9BACT|nr:hypothetical protein [Desulfobotulus pelophilus]MCW7755059.1 hypothetical protein [Desulfobotulus pelophilus]
MYFNTKLMQIVVLGLSPQGLALLRAYARSGFSVVAVGFPEDVGIYSRYGKVVVIHHCSEVPMVLSRFARSGCKIHITSDIMLNYIIDSLVELFDIYNISPPLNAAILLRDKAETYKYFSVYGVIACPKSYTLNDSINWHFPVIAKWNRTNRVTSFKTATIESHKDLTKYRYIDGLIFQEYIEAERSSNVSYCGYYENGTKKIDALVCQKRQYPIGISSCVVLLGNEHRIVIDVSRRILEDLRFDGFVEIEYRISSLDQKYYLIEVNPRACGWIKFLMPSFSHKILGNSSEKFNSKKVWINIIRDIRAIWHSKEMSLNNLRMYFREYFIDSIKDIYDVKDFKPFLFQFFKRLKK